MSRTGKTRRRRSRALVPRLVRPLLRLAGQRRTWLVLAVVATPLLVVNLLVASLGGSLVFPLSPFFVREKLHALGAYVVHRPGCIRDEHEALGPLITRAERTHGLPLGLMAALVEVESSSRVHRISPTGAMGPAQLMPATARALGVGDPFDPAANIDAGARLLATHMKRYRSIALAAAAYNAGPGAVRDRVPRNGETEHYVEKILRAYQRRRGRRTEARFTTALPSPAVFGYGDKACGSLSVVN